jgi:hypothetical protein
MPHLLSQCWALLMSDRESPTQHLRSALWVGFSNCFANRIASNHFATVFGKAEVSAKGCSHK